ncbi:hypothetical protein KAH94_00250 [bacterium]|nr:hypothetical protein [bacterium]
MTKNLLTILGFFFVANSAFGVPESADNADLAPQSSKKVMNKTVAQENDSSSINSKLDKLITHIAAKLVVAKTGKLVFTVEDALRQLCKYNLAKKDRDEVVKNLGLIEKLVISFACKIQNGLKEKDLTSLIFKLKDEKILHDYEVSFLIKQFNLELFYFQYMKNKGEITLEKYKQTVEVVLIDQVQEKKISIREYQQKRKQFGLLSRTELVKYYWNKTKRAINPVLDKLILFGGAYGFYRIFKSQSGDIGKAFKKINFDDLFKAGFFPLLLAGKSLLNGQPTNLAPSPTNFAAINAQQLQELQAIGIANYKMQEKSVKTQEQIHQELVKHNELKEEINSRIEI